ncbi:hypothetical protein [Marinobacter sp. NFXS9]|uniref:hypothetical protein n=1 Tax=Marinobacter sp. NFXS9 TaxID=2818433 RepID=UPI0032DF371B
MKTLTLTREERIETLFLKAEEIFQKSLVLTQRGIAHGHANFAAHVKTFRAEVKPLDAIYSGKEDHTKSVAEIDIDFDPFEWTDPEKTESEYRKQLIETDRYISYLNYLIELDKPFLLKAIGGAA